MEPEEAFEKLQQQELLQKFVEIGKVLLTWAILKNVDMVRIHIILSVLFSLYPNGNGNEVNRVKRNDRQTLKTLIHVLNYTIYII